MRNIFPKAKCTFRIVLLLSALVDFGPRSKVDWSHWPVINKLKPILMLFGENVFSVQATLGVIFQSLPIC